MAIIAKPDPSMIINMISTPFVQKTEFNEFKEELDKYMEEIKKIEKMSKANSWKNSKKK